MMSEKKRSKKSTAQPIVVGTGLVALDVVFSGNRIEPLGRWAGGTCGNVLAILSWLGWSAWPIARLKSGTEASTIRKDLKQWDVNPDFLIEEASGSTPVILQYIQENEAGETSHRFKMRCPVCGNRLPGFRPITRTTASELMERLPKADVFYFDRVSSGILDLVAHYSENGALIFFEPSGMGDARHFERAIELAHVVKFSEDRISSSQIRFPDTYPSLYIETQGEQGLRYRCRFEHYRKRDWQPVRAFGQSRIRDAAGAGDWCASGLIHLVGAGGVEKFKRTRKSDLSSAIQTGQAMSAWNCRFEGARGGMYTVSNEVFVAAIDQIRLAGVDDLAQEQHKTSQAVDPFSCSVCR